MRIGLPHAGRGHPPRAGPAPVVPRGSPGLLYEYVQFVVTALVTLSLVFILPLLRGVLVVSGLFACEVCVDPRPRPRARHLRFDDEIVRIVYLRCVCNHARSAVTCI